MILLSNKKYILYGAIAFCAVALEGCFTGIESTPKITADDVKRENIVKRPEDSFLADIKPEPFNKWKSGKRFYVTDEKFRILLQPTDSPHPDYSNTEIEYISANRATDIMGNSVTDISFSDSNGQKITYRCSESLDSLNNKGNLNIPFLVEMSVVEAVRERLKGNTYYVITSSWYDENTQSRRGKKFIPATVTNVIPGNAFYSAIIELIDENNSPFRLLVSVGDDLKTLRNFGALFSFKNPRLDHPEITDETWNLIINGIARRGMTREECRLSLGAPTYIDKSAGYSTLREVWSYENGVYLIFIDGILQTFRI